MNAKSDRPRSVAASALSLLCAGLLASCGGGQPETETQLAGQAPTAQTQLLPHEAHPLLESHRPLDIAINGGGMFVLLDVAGGGLVFSRRGRFDIDREGRLIDEANRLVVGLPSGPALQTDPARAHAPLPTLPPTAPSRASTKLSATINLDAGVDVIPSGAPLEADRPSPFHLSIAATVYDAAGQPVTLTLFFRKVDEVRWQLEAQAHGVSMAGSGVGFISFLPDGTPGGSPPVWRLDIPAGGSGDTRTLPITGLQLDLSGLTQWRTPFRVDTLSQDGAPAGRLASARIEADGRVFAYYDNGDLVEHGQIVLARFTIADRLIRRPAEAYVCGRPCAPPVLSLPGQQYGVGTLQMGVLDDDGG